MSRDSEWADRHLVKRINRGDKTAFKRFYLRYYKSLCLFCQRYVHSLSAAEEVVQEVFVDIWDNKDTWKPEKSIKIYLYKSVKYRALDYLKHQKVKRKNEEQWMEARENPTIEYEYDTEQNRLITAVRKAVEMLPDRCKMVYKLHRRDGLTYREIAEVMDISIKTVESQMTRALKKIRKQLAEYDFDIYSIYSDL